jgi:hypothetical protein
VSLFLKLEWNAAICLGHDVRRETFFERHFRPANRFAGANAIIVSDWQTPTTLGAETAVSIWVGSRYSFGFRRSGVMNRYADYNRFR